MKRKEKGSITLEAAIFVLMFLGAYIMLMNLIQIVRTQSILQYAIDESAREISQYSYVLTKSGIVQKSMETGKKSNEFKADTQALIDAVKQVGASTNEAELVGNIEAGVSQIESYFSSADNLIGGIIAVAKDSGQSAVTNAAVEYASRGMITKQIQKMTGTKDADAYLEKLGVEDGLDGLDFSDSKWFRAGESGVPEIEIYVTYNMKYKFGFFEIDGLHYRLGAKTAIW